MVSIKNKKEDSKKLIMELQKKYIKLSQVCKLKNVYKNINSANNSNSNNLTMQTNIQPISLKTPKVSIVIPCYNVESYLNEFRSCMDSVLAQTLQEIEIIAVNNGSHDCTGELLVEYTVKDNRLRIITLRENVGHGGGRNEGLKYVQGKYVFFADSDDWLYPDLCAKSFYRAEEYNADVVVFYPDASEWNWDYHWALPQDGCIEIDTQKRIYSTLFHFNAQWNKVIKTDFLRKNNIQFADQYFDDHLFCWQVLTVAKKTVALHEILYKWRNRSTGVSNTNIVGLLDCWNTIKKIQQHLQEKDIYSIWQNDFLNYKWRMVFNVYEKILSKNKDNKFDCTLRKLLSICHDETSNNDVEFMFHFSSSIHPHAKKILNWYMQYIFPHIIVKIEKLQQNNNFEKPIVSFIVPVYKVEPDCLRECLDSIAIQTLKNIEVICVNNGSPDNSGKILEEYAARDSRFKVITLNDNRRSGGGRNAAYPYIRGKYVQFVDCDDIVSPILCERTVEEAERTNSDVVFFDYYTAQNITSPYYAAKAHEPCFDMDSNEGYRIFTCYTLVWDRLWRTEYLLSNNLYFHENMFCEDVWFVWEAQRIGGKFIRIPDVLYMWRPRPTSTTRSESTVHLDIVPMLDQIKKRLIDTQCYEKFKFTFLYTQALFIHNEYSIIASKFPTELHRVEQAIVPSAEEIYAYFADESCDFARIHPQAYQYTKQVLQKILHISEPIPIASVTMKVMMKTKIKLFLKRILRPFRSFIERCFNLVGRSQIMRIDHVEQRINGVQSYQAHLLEQQRKESDALREQVSKLAAELKNLQEQYNCSEKKQRFYMLTK
ncbi:MAG: glycosyltransferase [Planctomycetaceae bacterium]|jgi:glycosyltransferase involved in cell wall biosynthesis|nr:glycosyltransferase [Planctomycetaceae bacterium]